ncbi:15733_t:CDS:2 [Acaulospora colombiana]|uniref:15733_t:CDS:1 n=1 Tax=Acaulospora colombiana TaxID=27376 RepID=A0ACA9L278_9GLOM|nr:15733_t:CDS:2 [Acaulospora colombiana]
MSGMKETDMSDLVALLMRVARAFFQTQHIVVLDQLTRHESISDENLSRGVGLTVKEIHRLCGTLKEARLIREFAKTEPKKAEQRAISRTYYYIDWQQELENKGYLCPGCKKTFAPLEIRNLIDMTRGVFLCDLCHTELIHNDNAENVKGTEKLHGRFMEQSQPIIDLLKAIDKLVIPVSSVEKLQVSSGTKGGQPGSTQEQDLQYSQDTGTSSGDIVVVIQGDNEASKTERQAETEKRRQQNALPSWHVRSTVSGDIMVSNAGNAGTTQENEQKAEIGIVNEKDDERENFYANYYASLYQDEANGSSPVAELEDDEFVENGYTYADYEDLDVDFPESDRSS